MQKQSLIPTPLVDEERTHGPIEIREPGTVHRLRLVRMLIFIFRMIMRANVAKVLPRLNRNYGPVEKAKHLRAFMEKMGGLWVKTGQIVALRRDVFSEEFCAELAKLQDRATGYPFAYARSAIESELGKPIREIFSEFSETPVAAASIGQVYRARLRDPDVEVVVKVRRPGIDQSFVSDLRYLRVFFTVMTALRVTPHLRWMEMFWELENAIMEELDYRQEAASLRRMRKNLRSHGVYVPKVFLDYCSDRVLVMERVQGVYMSDYIRVSTEDPAKIKDWLKKNNINAYKAGERLLLSHYRQLYEDNLYHCDLHPGNVLLMRKSRITLIDFGSVGSTDKTQLMKALNFMQAFVARDYKKAVDLWLLIPQTLPSRDLTDFKNKMVRIYRKGESRMKIKSLPYHEKSLSAFSGEVTQYSSEVGIPAAWDFLRQIRAQGTIDASLMVLMPELNYQKVMKKYVNGLRERESQQNNSGELLRARIAQIGESTDVPAQLAENAYFEGEYLRKRALKYEGYLSKASQIGGYVFLAMSRSLWFIALGMLIVGLHQRFNILKRLDGTWVHNLLQQIPRFDMVVWSLAAIAAVYVRREFVNIADLLALPQPAKVSGDRR